MSHHSLAPVRKGIAAAGVLLAGLSLLAGCGQKGPLTLATPAPAPSASSPSPAK